MPPTDPLPDPAGPGHVPDIMNDPAYDPNSASSDKASDDPDTCRICRGDGTRDEPLFYPCKCSGSIKFVHQECLMEWLSHSQKKHCELCKTPFRFTKLYHPHMPNKLPTTVFLRRAVVHVLKHLMTWCRGLLVGSVWLLWLPWCMRVIWRALFWCGDGGFAGDLHRVANIHRQRLASHVGPAEIGDGNRTMSNLTGAEALPAILAPFSQTLNMSAGEATVYTLIKKFLFGFGPLHADFFNSSFVNSTEDATVVNLITHRQSSLLSDVSFLRSVTSHPSINRLILDIIEGQIITILVVIAFILIFLIREWVVQQQPVINVAAMQPINQPMPPARQERPNDAAEAVAEEQREDVNEMEEDDGASDSDQSETSEESLGRYGHFDFAQGMPEEELDDTASHLPDIVFQSLERIPDPVVRKAIARSDFQKLAEVLAQRDPLARRVIRKELFMWIEWLGELVKAKPKGERMEKWIEVRDWAKHLEDIIVPPYQKGKIPKPSLFEPFELDLLDALGGPAPSSSATTEEEIQANTTAGPSEGLSIQHRPNMPERGQSFLAAQIRRDLEEATRNFASLPETPEERVGETDGERQSNNSEGSWQQVSDPEIDGIDHGLPRTSVVPLNDSAYRDFPNRAEASSSTGPRSLVGTSRPSVDGLDGQADERPGSAPNAPSSSDVAATLNSTDEELQPLLEEIAPTPTSEHDNSQQADAEPSDALQPTGQSVQDVGLCQSIYNWLWGDIVPAEGEDAQMGANDEHVVQNLADEAPFVQRDAGIDDDFEQPGAAQDPEVAAAAAQAGIDINDADAVDDAEDLEGIMELIGMQGPMVGLFQNALFSAVLISATVAVAVWIPYLWGKVVLLSLGSPVWLFLMLPLRISSAVADFIVDSALFLGAALVYWTITLLQLLLPIVGSPESLDSVASSTRTVAETAIERISKLFTVAGTSMNSDYLHLSISSHAALRSLQRGVNEWTTFIWTGVLESWGKLSSMESFSVFSALRHGVQAGVSMGASAVSSLRAFLPTISTTNGLSVTLETGNSTASAVDPVFEYWTATDRVIAILAGYVFFAIAGALYLKRGTPFTSSQNGRRVEGIISDVLQQAGGVLKVILIISIEMLAFPLYCGILLDAALLPLFEHATVTSRIEFARTSPWTAGFVHWFVGTCYMFHFALFVSMCRKIMRTGVLYFIRDPDDPTFHPVRDVLERSVIGQLRKIAFSAFVYGALVICCLGGVVWSLYYGFDGVLPIHWATNDPSMEFPLDLLFFNFLTPLIIRVFKPSDALHEMYQWWFRRCARALRLSDFLFGEKFLDERGRHIRRTWAAWFGRKKGNVEAPVIGEDRRLLAEDRNTEVYFLFDGRYVRAPASDQVRIRRGQSVFVDVDGFDNRLDGKSDEDGVHGKHSGLTATVYIPPWFRFRICLFVLAIWLFAAATGVGVTVIPLLFGRRLFSNFMPEGSHINDIYAFSVGIYIFGVFTYGLLHLRTIGTFFTNSIRHPFSTTYSTISLVGQYALQALGVTYVYGALIILLPVLFATFLEFYVLIPLHSYLGPGETHVIHIIQDWTLGFLYARIAARILLWNPRSLISRALQAVVRDGYLRPNARLATRAFVLPIGVFFAATLLAPLLLAQVANSTYFVSAEAETKTMVYSLVYPLTLAVALAAWTAYGVVRATERWRQRIKDEVYLIGERLHNLGERKAGPPLLFEAPAAAAEA